MQIAVNFLVQVDATSCHSNWDSSCYEQLFNALKAIETLASGIMKVSGLPTGQRLDLRNDMARVTAKVTIA